MNHSTLGWRVIQKKTKQRAKNTASAPPCGAHGRHARCGVGRCRLKGLLGPASRFIKKSSRKSEVRGSWEDLKVLDVEVGALVHDYRAVLLTFPTALSVRSTRPFQ